MDWGKFFEDTRKAAGVDSFAKLAPMLHVTDGAISHYRTGKRVPPAWTIAAALKIQGRQDAEKEAARIMREAAKSSEERAFWRKLGAAAALFLAVALPFQAHAAATVIAEQDAGLGIMRSGVRWRAACSKFFPVSRIPLRRNSRGYVGELGSSL